MPGWSEELSVFSRCCCECQLKNLSDNMGMKFYARLGVTPDEHTPRDLPDEVED